MELAYQVPCSAMGELTTDESLMLEYAGGSYEAFEVLYTRHKSAVLRFYRRQIGTAVAEELLQEAFMRIINARERYTPTASFRTYFWTIVRNVLIDHYRKINRSLPQSYSFIDPDTGVSPNQTIALNQTAFTSQMIADERVQPDISADQSRQVQKLLNLVSTLPSAQREAFLLKEESGLSLAEIAEIAGTSIDTIKSRLRYAVSKIRHGMEAS